VTHLLPMSLEKLRAELIDVLNLKIIMN